MVLLQLKKIMVNSSSTMNGSIGSPTTCAATVATTTNHFDSTTPICKSNSPFLDTFSSASMISSNELFKERMDLKKKKQLSLNTYHSSSPTLNLQITTPTTPTPTTPHSPSHSAHSPSRVGGKQPRSRIQSIGTPNKTFIPSKEKVFETTPTVFDVCFGLHSEVKKDHHSHLSATVSSTDNNAVSVEKDNDELKQFQSALLAEYCKLRPVTVQVDREKRTDKTNVCSSAKNQVISITLQLPAHLNRCRNKRSK